MLELNHVNCLSGGFLRHHMSTSLKSVFILLVESEMLDVLPPDLSFILSMQLKSPTIRKKVFIYFSEEAFSFCHICRCVNIHYIKSCLSDFN